MVAQAKSVRDCRLSIVQCARSVSRPPMFRSTRHGVGPIQPRMRPTEAHDGDRPIFERNTGPLPSSRRGPPPLTRLLPQVRPRSPCREFNMANKMLIDASHPEETRVVVVRGQKVEEFDFESANRKQLRGQYLSRQGDPRRAVAAGGLRGIWRQPPRLPGLQRNPSRLLPDPGRRPSGAARGRGRGPARGRAGGGAAPQSPPPPAPKRSRRRRRRHLRRKPRPMATTTSNPANGAPVLERASSSVLGDDDHRHDRRSTRQASRFRARAGLSDEVVGRDEIRDDRGRQLEFPPASTTEHPRRRAPSDDEDHGEDDHADEDHGED